MFLTSPLRRYSLSPSRHAGNSSSIPVPHAKDMCMMQPPLLPRRAGNSSSVPVPHAKDMCNGFCYLWFQIHGPDWDMQLDRSLEMAILCGGPCHKLDGGGLHVLKQPRLLISKAFSFFENELKCLLLQETFSSVLFFLSTPRALGLLDSHSHLSHSAQYFGVPDCSHQQEQRPRLWKSLKN